MDVGKKKVKEELDLTKIAEAFSGYVVETNGKNGKNGKKNKPLPDPWYENDPDVEELIQQAQKDTGARAEVEQDPEASGYTKEFSSQQNKNKNEKRKLSNVNPTKSPVISNKPLTGQALIDAAKKRREERGTKKAETTSQSGKRKTSDTFTVSQQKKLKKQLADKKAATDSGIPKERQLYPAKKGAEYKQQRTQDKLKEPPTEQPKVGQSGLASGVYVPPKEESKPSFNKFREAERKARQDRNLEDTKKADEYKQTPEYKVKSTGVDPTTGKKLDLGTPEGYQRYMELIGKKPKPTSIERKGGSVVDQQQTSNRSNVGDQEGLVPRNKLDTDTKTSSKREPSPYSTTFSSSKSKRNKEQPKDMGTTFTDFAQRTQVAQQSLLGALGGFVTKQVSPEIAGAEAGLRFAKGQYGAGTLSALQSMGGVIGAGAGIANAIRSVSQGKRAAAMASKQFQKDMATRKKGSIVPSPGGKLSTDTKGIPAVSKGGLSPMDTAAASALGAYVFPRIGRAVGGLRPTRLQGGRAGTRSAAR